jgi:hypothetical protein
MKNNQDQTTRKRGMLAKVFMAMLAMSAMSPEERGKVNIGPGGGIGNYGGWRGSPNRHPKKSYAQQNREARKRRNILSRSKH